MQDRQEGEQGVEGEGVEEEVTEEHVAQFERICREAALLAQDYQKQSESLKEEMIGMVGLYNKNQSPEQAVPVEQILQMTSEYQSGMREVQAEYGVLSQQLQQEEKERNQMMEEINSCFEKLERMEKLFRQKAKPQQEQPQQNQ